MDNDQTVIGDNNQPDSVVVADQNDVVTTEVKDANAVLEQNAVLLKELKAYKTKAKAFEAAESKRQEEKLRAEGKLQEALELKDKQLNELALTFKTTRLDTQLKEAALKEGCTDLNAFMKLGSSESDIKDIFDADNNYLADPSKMATHINFVKEQFATLGLFKKDVKAVVDTTPGKVPAVKSIESMSLDEQKAYALKIAKENKLF